MTGGPTPKNLSSCTFSTPWGSSQKFFWRARSLVRLPPPNTFCTPISRPKLHQKALVFTREGLKGSIIPVGKGSCKLTSFHLRRSYNKETGNERELKMVLVADMPPLPTPGRKEAFTTTTEIKLFGQLFWPQKTFDGGGCKNPIKCRETISTTEIFPLWPLSFPRSYGFFFPALLLSGSRFDPQHLPVFHLILGVRRKSLAVGAVFGPTRFSFVRSSI